MSDGKAGESHSPKGCSRWRSSILFGAVLSTAACPVVAYALEPYGWRKDMGQMIVAQADTKQADELVNRGNAHADKKDYDRAIADFDQAIKLDPENAYAYNSRADTLREAGKAELALPDAEKAVQLDPNNADFWDTRAQIFQALGRRREAIADYRHALELDPMLTETRERLKRLGVSP